MIHYLDNFCTFLSITNFTQKASSKKASNKEQKILKLFIIERKYVELGGLSQEWSEF